MLSLFPPSGESLLPAVPPGAAFKLHPSAAPTHETDVTAADTLDAAASETEKFLFVSGTTPEHATGIPGIPGAQGAPPVHSAPGGTGHQDANFGDGGLQPKLPGVVAVQKVLVDGTGGNPFQPTLYP